MSVREQYSCFYVFHTINYNPCMIPSFIFSKSYLSL